MFKGPSLLRLIAVASALAVVFSFRAGGQMRVAPIDTMAGHAALGLALRHLSNTGIYMMATAHPDDENNGLLVLLNRGLGFRTTLATATRGNGGQNEIGPELFEPLGVLRTAELAALHRFDGAEQYFTRAVDFGYTIDIPETMAKWGRDEIIGDYVRLIRTIRPDVISAQSPNAVGPGQHAHHASAAILSREAYKLAGDPTKYPEQLREGLRVWQPRKFYNAAGQGSVGFAEAGATSATPAEPQRACRVTLDVFDQLLGRTYSEIGTEARSMHKCQGQAQLLALPAPSTTALQLAETTIAGQMDRDEGSLFDGVDYSIGGLAKFAGAQPPAALVEALGTIASTVQLAQRRFETEGDEATVPTLLAGLRILTALEGRLSSLPIDQTARFEIQFRLGQKSREFQQAILMANAVRLETLADDGVVIPGQPLRVNLLVANRGAEFSVKQVKVNGLSGATTCTLTASGGRGGGRGGGGGRAAGPGRAGAGTGAAAGGAAPAAGGRAADPAGTGAARGNAAGTPAGRAGAQGARGGGGRGRGNPAPDPPVSTFARNQIAGCTISATVPADARITEPYWHRAGDAGRYTFDADAAFGLPQRPSPFSAQVTLAFVTGEEVTASQPIEYRYQGDIFSGEKRTELLVVPALSVRVTPDVLIVPASTAPAAPATTAGRTASDRDVRVTVINDGEGAVESVVKLGLPAGWIATPPEQPVKFARSDESQTVNFRVRPPRGVTAGSFSIKATATADGATYDRGFQVIEYPHIRRQHIFESALVAVKVLNVKTAPNLSVGYIMGAGDEGPAALEQIGARVTMLRADDLASGNLAQFGAIVTGVRAYENRDDLIANNSRLLQYVSNGGTLIVQYNRNAFNAAQYGPYPAQVSDSRVTDEQAPVTLLVPAHPVFTTPNRITPRAWEGWVQERGLQFLGERDGRYRDLVELEDTFPNNPGKKRGALVEAQYGRGRWIYLGLGLWRELPAGVEGAYELLANLVSLGK